MGYVWVVIPASRAVSSTIRSVDSHPETGIANPDSESSHVKDGPKAATDGDFKR